MAPADPFMIPIAVARHVSALCEEAPPTFWLSNEQPGVVELSWNRALIVFKCNHRLLCEHRGRTRPVGFAASVVWRDCVGTASAEEVQPRMNCPGGLLVFRYLNFVSNAIQLLSTLKEG